MIRAVEKVCERCPVAFVLGTYWNGHYTYERIAYDQAYRSKSPGSILLYRVLEELISTDTPRVFDFTAGEADEPPAKATASVSTPPPPRKKHERPDEKILQQAHEWFMDRLKKAGQVPAAKSN